MDVQEESRTREKFRKWLECHRWHILAFVWIMILILMGIFYRIFPNGDLFSFGQFIIEFILIPIAAIGFWFAYLEFRRGLVSPKLRLILKQSSIHGHMFTDRIVFNNCNPEPDSYFETRQYVNIYLENHGDSICRFFQVVIKFPILRIYGGGDPDEQIEKWSGYYDSEHYILSFEDRFLRISFQSLGEVVSFVDDSILVGGVEIETFTDEREVVSIPYQVFTDRRKPVRGVLEVVLNP